MKIQKAISFILVAALCVSFAGCGTNTSASTTTAVPSSSSASSSSEVSFPSTYHFDPPASYADESSSAAPYSTDSFKEIYSNCGKYTIVKEDNHNYDKAMLVAEYKNTSDKQISVTDISMDVKDKKGNLLGTISTINFSPAVVEPGQSTFIHEDLAMDLRVVLHKDYLDVSTIGKETFTFNVQSDTDVEKIDASVENVNLSQGDDGSVIATGMMNFKSSESSKDIYIDIPIRDKSNTIKTILFCKINAASGGKKGFTATEVIQGSKLDASQLHINKNEIVIADTRRQFGANIIS